MIKGTTLNSKSREAVKAKINEDLPKPSSNPTHVCICGRKATGFGAEQMTTGFWHTTGIVDKKFCCSGTAFETKEEAMKLARYLNKLPEVDLSQAIGLAQPEYYDYE